MAISIARFFKRLRILLCFHSDAEQDDDSIVADGIGGLPPLCPCTAALKTFILILRRGRRLHEETFRKQLSLDIRSLLHIERTFLIAFHTDLPKRRTSRSEPSKHALEKNCPR